MQRLSTLLVYGIVAGSLLACSNKEEAARGAPASAAPAPSTADVAPLKVAFVYAGPVNEAGWNFAHDSARRVVEQEFGSRVSTRAVDHVPETADAARVLSDLCEQGQQLVFGTSFGFMGPILEVAAQHPSVKFEHATG